MTTAVAYYREAIRLSPEFADAHSNLGNVLKVSNQGCCGRIGTAHGLPRAGIALPIPPHLVFRGHSKERQRAMGFDNVRGR